MGLENIILELVLIFAGSALFATLFLFLKQPIILSYILLGMVIGPWGAGLIDDAEHIEHLSHIGIILLLFVIGLDLQPDRLLRLFGRVSLITVATSFAFLLIGSAVALAFGFSLVDSLVVGAALMFSSTIVGLKLIPTWTLHHKHTGEMMISVLLMQDILAILLILLLSGGDNGIAPMTVIFTIAKLFLVSVAAYVLVRYVISSLFIKFDSISEYAFLLSLGWGLLIAGLAKMLGLSYEIGAFIAGVSFATLPVALPIADTLKPLRDFFLILFFFSIGAQFNYLLTENVLVAGLVLTLIVMLTKPFIFRWGFISIGEKKGIAKELGVRLGQGSEFSLLVAYSALASGVIEARTSYLIQTVVILTFVFSTYWVVLRYPTPISSQKDRLED